MVSHFLVCDVEATSANPLNAQLLTGCFMLCDSDFDIVDRLDLKARPRFWDKEAEEASSIHGITLAKANTFPAFNDAMETLKIWLDSIPPSHFVAHANRNIFGKFSTYDYAVLTSNLFDYKFSHYSLYRSAPRKLILSTHSLAKFLSIDSALDLKSLANKLGVELSEHHDAQADAMACYEIFKKLFPRVELNTFLDYENFKLEVKNDANEYNSGPELQRASRAAPKKSQRIQKNTARII